MSGYIANCNSEANVTFLDVMVCMADIVHERASKMNTSAEWALANLHKNAWYIDQISALNSTVNSTWPYLHAVLVKHAKITKFRQFQVGNAPILNSANVHTNSSVNPSPQYIDRNYVLNSTVNSTWPYLNAFFVHVHKFRKCRQLQSGNTAI
jgi:hypothetical protein